MRIHRLHLEDFRGVADREVVFATTGITVVDGPNEVGKSSLGDALDMVLRRHDSSEARDVRDAAPAGRDCGPFVEVEISTGPYRFVFAKRWLRGHMTRLDVLEPERRQLTGREAHDAVEAMLAETLDADLWHALRVAQGTADGPVAVHTRSLARVLDGAMGVEATGGDEQLVERIEGERLQYWTPTGRPRGERVELARTVAELAERDAEIVRQLDDLVDAATRVEGLGVHRAGLVAQRTDAETALAKVTERVAALADARRGVAVAERRAESTRAAHVAAQVSVDRRHELIDDVESARADLDKLRLDLERSVAAAGDARAQESAAVAALEAATGELTSLDRWVRFLECRRDRLAVQGRVDALWGRVHAATAADAEQRAAQAQLASLPQIDTTALTALESAAMASVVATARLDGASTRVDLDALMSMDLNIDGVSESIAAGSHLSWSVAEVRTFELADQIRLTVSPGEGAADLLATADAARNRLAALCAELGVADAEEARTIHEQRRSTEADVAAAAAELDRSLGTATLEGLIEDVAALEAQLSIDTTVADALDATGVDASGVAVAGVAVSDLEVESALESARSQLSSLRTRRDDLAADADHHRERAQRARMEDTTLVGRIEQADSHHDRVAARLTAARVAADDGALDVAVASCLAERESAEMALGAARHELDALHPDELEAELHRCTATLQSLDAQISSTSSEIERLQARLDVGGEQGLASELDDVRSRHAHLQRRLTGLERNAAAARRLHETVEAHRDAARRRYQAPFRDELERLGRLVFGPELTFELDDDLHVVRRTLDGITLEVDQLSVGAREQLGLLARLACASIVSTEGGAPVMFDDVLGHSDPDRVAAMGRALAASARDGQVIITTCAPERYEGLDATRVTLS